MRLPECIETLRLILRRPVAGDAQAIFDRYANDPEVTRFLSWPRHRTVEDSVAFIGFSDSAWSGGHGGPYLIESRKTGVVLGGAGFIFEEPEIISVGYVLAKDAWGHGYATEALSALVGAAENMRCSRLVAYCHPAHKATIRVLEKCGFTLETGHEIRAAFPNLGDGDRLDLLCYATNLQDRGTPSISVAQHSGNEAITTRIEYLADHPEHIPTLSHWFYEQWSWFLPPESSAGTIATKFCTHLNHDAPPLALVALDGNELLGTASLRVHDMDIFTELSPWLGGVYVTPGHRGKGIGRRLVTAVERKARELGYRSIYLFTYDRARFYQELDWRILTQLEYHGHPIVVMHKPLSVA